MLYAPIHRTRSTVATIVGTILLVSTLHAGTPQPPDGLLPVEDFSPGFLGMYRKVMEIEDEISKYAAKYDVDLTLARAMCIHESGGNANLNSAAGARGYFQVMPSTFRMLRVKTNIEAGIKYLSQLIRRFEREDYALGAYNGGPSRVARGRPPLETLQYILFVGQYRSVLKLHEPSIRHHASQIQLDQVREGDDWWTTADRLGMTMLQLRVHNPFLATRTLRVGQLVAYPLVPRTDLFIPGGDGLEYRTRHGDNYLLLSFVLDVDRDALRDQNGLWRLQTLPADQVLQIPLTWKGKHIEYETKPGDTLGSVAKAMKSKPWRIIRDNNLFWDETLRPGMVLKVRPSPPKPTYITHRVARGDTLLRLADRYGTNVRTIQAANKLGRSTTIRIGQRLRVPTRANVRPSPPKPTYITHRVARGDTLLRLADRYGTNVRTIQATNKLGRSTTIRIGQRLRVPTRVPE